MGEPMDDHPEEEWHDDDHEAAFWRTLQKHGYCTEKTDDNTTRKEADRS